LSWVQAGQVGCLRAWGRGRVGVGVGFGVGVGVGVEGVGGSGEMRYDMYGMVAFLSFQVTFYNFLFCMIVKNRKPMCAILCVLRHLYYAAWLLWRATCLPGTTNPCIEALHVCLSSPAMLLAAGLALRRALCWVRG
jgi:hypothetical protein